MLSRYAKALTAAITAAAVPLGGAVTASSDQGSTITQGEWITTIVAAIVAGFAVAAVPNRPPKGRPSDPAISEQGYTLVDVLVIVAVILLIVVLLLFLFGRA